MFEVVQVIVVAAFFVAFALFAISQWRRMQGRRPPEHSSTIKSAAPGTARDLKVLVERLSKQNAMWPQILASVNPTDDRRVSSLLVQLRGPHMFAPHIALEVLRTGCQTVPPEAPAERAISAAVDSMNKVVKFGD